MSRMQYDDVSWERMLGAVEKVRQRLSRAVSALDQAEIPYAVDRTRHPEAVSMVFSPTTFPKATLILRTANKTG